VNERVPTLPDSWPPPYPLHGPIDAATAGALDRAAQAAGIPSLVLMEHAAQGVAALAAALLGPTETVLVVCGPGNNGGDGYAAARFLAAWGRKVRVLACAPRPKGGDAGLEAALLGESVGIEDAWGDPGLVARALAEGPGLVVDALFGVGLTRPLGPPYREWVEDVNRAQTLRLSVDVPSGLDADTGRPLPVCVRADVTATMAATKSGLVGAGPLAGRVVQVDIGLPAAVLAPFRARRG
jgi:NAD(P)H-hydrate epimerase